MSEVAEAPKTAEPSKVAEACRVALRDYQMDAVEQARQCIRDGAKNVLIVAPTGSGKCLGRGTPVLMFDGRIKAVEDVVTGDLLMGPDSTPRQVLSTTQGVGPLYRVIPTKGDSYIVNDAHILSLKITGGATKWDCSRSDTYRTGKIHNITVTDYLSRSKTFKHCAKGWRTGIEFSAQDKLPLDPYFFGAWIGDGTSKNSSICSADDEVLQCVADMAELHGLKVRTEIQKDNQSVVAHVNTGVRGRHPANRTENPVLMALKNLGVLNNKHIPHCYLTASRNDRLELLAGLMDTDGSLSGGGFDFIQKELHIVESVAFLARSLGLAAYISGCTKTCVNNGKSGEYWRLSISGDCSIVPVRIPRKKASPRLIKKDALLTGIKVQRVGEGDYFGFEITGDRLFLLGDFTVTHNTVVASHLIDEAQRKGRRSAFVVDRLSLIQQTSDTFDRYGIDHGVIQGNHWRFRPHLPVQICSQQTVAKRQWPEAQLIIIDEAHTVTETVVKRITPRDTVAIGLTATPFTKGLGKHYDAVVNVTTTNRLIEQGFLSNYVIYSCVEPDMEGVNIIAGEFEEGETAKRALKVVGDVVKEYIEKGDNRKFICSAVDVAHVTELQRQFLAAGINVATYTYKDGEDDRADTLQEYRKSDSAIRGLITVTAASKGFDCADIGCVIMARPLAKSLAEHIQFFGRGLRISEGKENCIVLDHSGNSARFWHEWNDFFENGITELDDGKKKEKPKPKEKDEADELTKCPQCRALHKPAPACPSCGHEYPRKKAVEHVPGTLKELVATGNVDMMRRELWPQVCSIVLETTPDFERAQRRAQAIYHELTGTFAKARIENTTPVAPTTELRKKVKANQIRFIKGRQAASAREAVPA